MEMVKQNCVPVTGGGSEFRAFREGLSLMTCLLNRDPPNDDEVTTQQRRKAVQVEAQQL